MFVALDSVLICCMCILASAKHCAIPKALRRQTRWSSISCHEELLPPLIHQLIDARGAESSKRLLSSPWKSPRAVLQNWTRRYYTWPSLQQYPSRWWWFSIFKSFSQKVLNQSKDQYQSSSPSKTTKRICRGRLLSIFRAKSIDRSPPSISTSTSIVAYHHGP